MKFMVLKKYVFENKFSLIEVVEVVALSMGNRMNTMHTPNKSMLVRGEVFSLVRTSGVLQ